MNFISLHVFRSNSEACKFCQSHLVWNKWLIWKEETLWIFSMRSSAILFIIWWWFLFYFEKCFRWCNFSIKIATTTQKGNHFCQHKGKETEERKSDNLCCCMLSLDNYSHANSKARQTTCLLVSYGMSRRYTNY